MPDAVVIKVEKKAEKNALIHFDVGEVAWSPDYEVASKLLIGKPLPADWTVKAGEYGPQAFPPRPKGSAPQAAFRNTKEGFLAEAEGRLRWQQVEEERRDRRTALMQAVALAGPSSNYETSHVLELADDFYTWIRQTSGALSSASASLPVSSPAGGAPEDNVGEGSGSRPADAPSSVASASPTTSSGTGAGEAGTAPEGYGEGPDGAVPATTELATADDLAAAAKHGLTPTKAKAIAASLGITVTKATELTREQLAAVINRYLEVKK